MSRIKKLVMATNNKNKLREAREIFSPIGIEVLSQKDLNIECDPEENGKTFAENAKIKAEALYSAIPENIAVIADDSGLCVDILNGRPGVYSARYAPDGQKCSKLLDEMKDIPDDKRTAYFECCIAFIDENGEYKSFSGKCMGKIGYEEKGTNGFGYDPIFVYGDKTLAEMSAEEKNNISHRGNALKELYKYLKESE
ncbi:MAG: RdgB/HAM1 family non-canonical purine NTP pyrophosphatase [Ruminococcus sp.]|nr:RdgB/HAM1 family non-canonical purine NTP pyrophosphatase [Ruminococcus sp.]